MKAMEENVSQVPPSLVVESTRTPPPVNRPPFGSWRKLGALVLGAVILAGGIFFAGYQYSQKEAPSVLPTPTPSPVAQITPSPTPDQTANWKTYKSPKHGFTIRYPDTIDLKEEVDGSVLLTLWGPTQRRDTEFYDGISLRLNSGSLGGKKLKEFVDEKVAQAKENVDILKPPVTTVVGGIAGYTFTVQGLGIFRDIYLSPGPETYIEITDATRDPTGKGFQKTVEQILSTLKLLD